MASPVLERFLRYVTCDTQAREDSITYPMEKAVDVIVELARVWERGA